jgi:mono/diheme cytochrome c family protein
MCGQLWFGLAVLSILFPLLSFSQAPVSVWDGIYTNEQAGKGETAYGANCASCHGEKLQGRGPTPPLAGTDFTSNWTGMTVGDLFEKIQSSMPADRPGQLTKEQNAAILAYMLKFNKVPAGESELVPDVEALRRIRFEAGKP